MIHDDDIAVGLPCTIRPDTPKLWERRADRCWPATIIEVERGSDGRVDRVKVRWETMETDVVTTTFTRSGHTGRVWRDFHPVKSPLASRPFRLDIGAYPVRDELRYPVGPEVPF